MTLNRASLSRSKYKSPFTNIRICYSDLPSNAGGFCRGLVAVDWLNIEQVPERFGDVARVRRRPLARRLRHISVSLASILCGFV
jgi:hypothetical protein